MTEETTARAEGQADPAPFGKRRVKVGKRKRVPISEPKKSSGGGHGHGARGWQGHRISAAPAGGGGACGSGGGGGGGGEAPGGGGGGGGFSVGLPPTHAQDRELMMKCLQQYRSAEARIKESGRAKPDMIAYSEVRDSYPPAKSPRWGHVPGTEVGESLTGRGEIAITGLHIRMMQGIDFDRESMEPGGGAYAICLAGGYKDDDDKGLEIWYTGQGGQKGKVQVADQKLEKGNLALARSVESKRSVRVIRKGTEKNQYVYEGEYRVEEYVRVASEDGPYIYKFKLCAIPGKSKAPAPPTGYRGPTKARGCFNSGARGNRNDTLDVRGRRIDGGKRAWSKLVRRTEDEFRVAEMERIAVYKSAAAEDEAEAEAAAAAADGKEATTTLPPPPTTTTTPPTTTTRRRRRNTLLCLDVTQGRERVIVPVFNEVDDATDYVPEGFTYVRTSSERISAAAVAVLDSKDHPPAGPTERAHTGKGAEESSPAYNDEYCLMAMLEDGIVEPPPEGSLSDEDEDEGPDAAMGLLEAVERSGKRGGGGGGGGGTKVGGGLRDDGGDGDGGGGVGGRRGGDGGDAAAWKAGVEGADAAGREATAMAAGPGDEGTTAGRTAAKAGGAAGAGGSGAGALASSSSGAAGSGGVKPKKPKRFLHGPRGACVRLGMWLPLEVFRTVDKGWGLRCAIEIPAGAFVCEYAGEVLTDAETEASRKENEGDDDYIFNLDHFELLSQNRNDNDNDNDNTIQNGGDSGGGGGGDGVEKELSDDMSLCVDARMFGSVARFINHHSEGNLEIQTVFTPGVRGCRADNQKLYRIAFFASRDIKPMEELCYSYGEGYWTHMDKKMVDAGGQEEEEEDSDVAPQRKQQRKKGKSEDKKAMVAVLDDDTDDE